MEIEVRVLSNGLKGATAKAKKGIAAALAREKDVLLADMKRRTPVDEGDLRDSETAESDANSIRLRAGTDHAIFVHQGTKNADDTQRMAPRPFAKDAIEAGAPRVAASVGQSIAESLQ